MIYEYKCTNEECNHRCHINHSMADDTERKCPLCKNKLGKVFSSASPIYKTKGFYRTDYD